MPMEPKREPTRTNDEDAPAGAWAWWATKGADKRFGQRMRSIRTGRGMSQDHVAVGMARAGFSWHQTTVARTEAGKRPISLKEALGVASVLHCELPELLKAEASALPDWLTVARQELELKERIVFEAKSKLSFAELERNNVARDVKTAEILMEFEETGDRDKLESVLIEVMTANYFRPSEALFEAAGLDGGTRDDLRSRSALIAARDEEIARLKDRQPSMTQDEFVAILRNRLAEVTGDYQEWRAVIESKGFGVAYARELASAIAAARSERIKDRQEME